MTNKYPCLSVKKSRAVPEYLHITYVLLAYMRNCIPATIFKDIIAAFVTIEAGIKGRITTLMSKQCFYSSVMCYLALLPPIGIW